MDELMWLMAEQDDPIALESFGKRYPEYRAELGRRLHMVRDLKRSKPFSNVQAPIPQFQLRPPVHRTMPRWGTVAACSVLLVGLAFGSYKVVRSISEAKKPSPAPFSVPQAIATPSAGVAPRIKPSDIQGPQHMASVPPTPVPAIKSYEQPIDLSLEGVTLLDAVSTVVRMSGLRVEFAPGMPEVLVTVNYSGTKPLDILRDMGLTFGFTPFEQEPGTVLLIPATDPKVHTPPSSDAFPASGKPAIAQPTEAKNAR